MAAVACADAPAQGFDEETMRQKLFKYTQQPAALNKDLRAYLPPLGGATVYIFGDPRKLASPTTEVAVRVHDSCCGSDVFGAAARCHLAACRCSTRRFRH